MTVKKKYKDVYGEYLGTCNESNENKTRLLNIKNDANIDGIISGKYPPPHIHSIVFTYLLFDGTYYKIGQSTNVKKRFLSIRTGNPNVKIICFGRGRTEKNLHEEYDIYRIRGEWFDFIPEQVVKIIKQITGKVMSVEEAMDNSFISLNKNNSRCYLHFGKYKGEDIFRMNTDDELSYLRWLLEQEWLSEYYYNAIYKHIERTDLTNNQTK